MRAITLAKNDDLDNFSKKADMDTLVKESSFATNGSIMMIQTNKKTYFFDLKSGVLIQKVKAGLIED